MHPCHSILIRFFSISDRVLDQSSGGVFPKLNLKLMVCWVDVHDVLHEWLRYIEYKKQFDVNVCNKYLPYVIS